jgi:hypothetical protein
MTPILQYLTDRLFLLPLALLPHHRLSRVVHRLARSENRAFSQWLIRTITSVYQIDCSLAEEPDLSTYSSFNAFFTRSLKTGVRPIAAGEEIVVSPVDGVVSQCGPIMRESIFQAKGHQFNLTTLLGGDQGRAAPFTNGIFSTIYLSPRDYHRITELTSLTQKAICITYFWPAKLTGQIIQARVVVRQVLFRGLILAGRSHQMLPLPLPLERKLALWQQQSTLQIRLQ